MQGMLQMLYAAVCGVQRDGGNDEWHTGGAMEAMTGDELATQVYVRQKFMGTITLTPLETETEGDFTE